MFVSRIAPCGAFLWKDEMARLALNRSLTVREVVSPFDPWMCLMIDRDALRGAQQLRLYALDFPAGQGFLQEDMRLPVEGSASGQAFQTGKPLALSGPAWMDLGIYQVGRLRGCSPAASSHSSTPPPRLPPRRAGP
jgi:hypothetical protein